MGQVKFSPGLNDKIFFATPACDQAFGIDSVYVADINNATDPYELQIRELQ